MRSLRDLVAVACHAPFKESTPATPADPADDNAWVLQSFQTGEPPLYIEHARTGASLAAKNPEALLLFSGGFTRPEAGATWSEAATYLAIAKHFNWWMPPNDPGDLEQRAGTEDYSRDSFENLLFSILRFQELAGRYPDRVTMVSWEFKRARFDAHRAAIRFPASRWTFVGSGQPADFPPAARNEAATLRSFAGNLYGSAGELAEKRLKRNPLGREHPFRGCPEAAEFFRFIENPDNRRKTFPAQVPWE